MFNGRSSNDAYKFRACREIRQKNSAIRRRPVNRINLFKYIWQGHSLRSSGTTPNQDAPLVRRSVKIELCVGIMPVNIGLFAINSMVRWEFLDLLRVAINQMHLIVYPRVVEFLGKVLIAETWKLEARS